MMKTPAGLMVPLVCDAVMFRPAAYSFTQPRECNAMSKKRNGFRKNVLRETTACSTGIKNACSTGDKTACSTGRVVLAERWAALLRAHYGTRHAAKSIARDFGVEVRTASGWLSGQQAPQLSAFLSAAQLFGVADVIGVLWPESPEYQRSKIIDDLHELRSRLDALSHALGEAPPDNETDNGKDRPHRR